MPLEKIFKGKDINLKISKVESFSVDKKEVKLADGICYHMMHLLFL